MCGQIFIILFLGRVKGFSVTLKKNATLNLLQFIKELRPLTEVAILASFRWSKLDQGRQIKVEDHYNYLHKTWLGKNQKGKFILLDRLLHRLRSSFSIEVTSKLF